MELLREARQKKQEQLADFKEVYPQDQRALKYALRVCGGRCVDFKAEVLRQTEKNCLENCVWKFGQTLEHDF